MRKPRGNQGRFSGAFVFSCISVLIMLRYTSESTHDRVVASLTLQYRATGIHKKGGDANDNL